MGKLNDRITGAFARYYCDSISTVLLFLPAFPMTGLMMKDKRHKMRGLIYPRIISFAWILPTVLFIMAISLFVTVLSENYLAVLSAGFIWLAGRPSIDKIAGGNYGLSDLVIRHNTLKGYGRMMEKIRTLTANRLIITGTALVFAALAVFVYNAKQKGGMTFESRKFARDHRV